MGSDRLLQQVFSMTLVVLLLVGCSRTPTESASALTPIPPTETSTPLATDKPTQIPRTETPTPIPPTKTLPPSETSIPGGIITGRVYLMDRDEPVLTTVNLAQKEGWKVVDSTTTDKDGFYTFLVEKPDTYVIQVSIFDLLDICDNLRTESGGWIKMDTYDTSGVSDTFAGLFPVVIASGDEITLDCELYCD